MTIPSRSFTVAVFCGSSPGNSPVFIEAAVSVGRRLAERGIGIVYGGGHVGLMGAVADAAMAAGGTVTGVIPYSLQQREESNGQVSELIVVETMHERKSVMAERSDAFLALPGGPGTLEEITEQWTWAQLGIHEKPCGFLNVAGYYDPMIAMVAAMRDNGFTHPRYTDMVHFDADLDALVDGFLSYEPPTRLAMSPGAELSQTVLP
ncbi:TIGR00730 family Rossman fold protein [Lacisediminihabitans changchengi]|uniref:Cytokinin riboside 5'-monophosphate phosphoribohydrolase n=1 Tax=Lacisediminihabitans changchengi TaxID=2787634 RepID=A0A934SMU7_9MICO|nr:TIGR00730 family Rossman fold protein [Lacisediminihabitans changchengi]MBK4348265.1 TIGR00730 family Rossman fold protein [Lacisediminihabitans changchengi]